MLNARGFVDALLAAVPRATPLVDENRDDDGVVLLHLLLSDLLRLTVAAFGAGDTALVGRVLTVVEKGLREGDDHVAEAVAVSFVEHYGAAPGESDELLGCWPPLLRAELDRQRGRGGGASATSSARG
ncbi:hypothetical protein [Cellulomonas sp. B6]|uniref:DUF7674 family protein n=1 Tax=Cellulomonas sp. B6 TaxID=1295626 RepID=UPI00073C7713|nr:hypothetical protein [Cellulomonas sp. B6]KSW14092.1 hypothetical protein ATM99_02815 [Cellulomonas sp. B6]